ncbi:MAG TPA: cytochrome C [Gammaproteobacteria bacterium]|nr:cytochrome C [Gammaproteobacteria bacterium]
MQLINRKSFCSKAIVILLLMAASTMLYAGKPDKPGSRDASCTISTIPAPAVINAGESIDFTGSVSGKPSKLYAWTFDGGNPATSNFASVTITYTTDGTFDATLNGTNGKGQVCSATTTVTVNAGGGENQPPVAQPDSFATDEDTSLSDNVMNDNGNGVDTDPDGDNISVTAYDAISVQGASVSINANGDFTYDPAGAAALQALNNGGSIVDSFSYTISDDTSSPLTNSTTVSIAVSGITDGGGGSDVSINSTSQNGTSGIAVTEQPFVGNNSYKIFATNDLGMHCGDFDTRISSILPPFNVLHAQVIRRGGKPDILTRADGIDVVYSAASNPSDPIILTGLNAAGDPVLSSLVSGSVYKTNFWGIARDAYDPFYPPGILSAFYPAGVDIADLGLPMPDVERLYLGDGILAADQQAMPAVTTFNKNTDNLPIFLASQPYDANEPKHFEQFVTDMPFFTNPSFQFGYVSEGVNWFEAAGIPLTAFDDFGRENPWPLYRVQAKNSSGNVVASTDIVVPISGEANCGACHNATVDGGNGSATEALGGNVAILDDDDPGMPLEVSKEWAADINILHLHDLKHGSGQDVPKYSPDLVNQTPVICQSCHYTPALDLAQVGPKGLDDADANGRQQTNVRSMSNVMHSHHGVIRIIDNNDGETVSVVESGGRKLFPVMPTAEKDVETGVVANALQRRDVLEATCYQCHPGRRTDCLRGAMANGGMLCQDCHGDMEQVGDDFTRTVGEVGGGFELAGDFYDHTSETPRVPWANEPGCGSCHTGDAMNNLAGTAGAVVNNVDAEGNADGVRLFQAFRSGDAKATPIVPTNKRFAENVIEAENPAVTGPDDPRIGNPMLYRVSKGHEGVFCEACHGATHGIWPNKNPNANDNVTATQLQGHTGTITECDTCHPPSAFEDSGELQLTMGGPHGMHPVGSAHWNTHHKEARQGGGANCRTCHGPDGEGTVLSRMAQDRTLECKDSQGDFCTGEGPKLFPKGHVVGCNDCHANHL